MRSHTRTHIDWRSCGSTPEGAAAAQHRVERQQHPKERRALCVLKQHLSGATAGTGHSDQEGWHFSCERGCSRDCGKAGPISVERLKMDLPFVTCCVYKCRPSSHSYTGTRTGGDRTSHIHRWSERWPTAAQDRHTGCSRRRHSTRCVCASNVRVTSRAFSMRRVTPPAPCSREK